MDKKTIKQYGEDILSYRLRSARRKKRAQREDLDKRLIQIDKEEGALYEKRRSLGWEPLDPPIQAGWKRFFVLRSDVARSKHADFFAELLRKINTYDYHPRKDFRTKKGRKRYKKFPVKPQSLKSLHRSEFAKLTEREQQFFHPQTRIEAWSREPVVRYFFNEPWRFTLQVRPNMVGRRRIRDAELESRIANIRRYIERNNYGGRLSKLVYGKSRCRWGEPPEDDYPYRHWPVRKIIEATKEEIYNE